MALPAIGAALALLGAIWAGVQKTYEVIREAPSVVYKTLFGALVIPLMWFTWRWWTTFNSDVVMPNLAQLAYSYIPQGDAAYLINWGFRVVAFDQFINFFSNIYIPCVIYCAVAKFAIWMLSKVSQMISTISGH